MVMTRAIEASIRSERGDSTHGEVDGSAALDLNLPPFQRRRSELIAKTFINIFIIAFKSYHITPTVQPPFSLYLSLSPIPSTPNNEADSF